MIKPDAPEAFTHAKIVDIGDARKIAAEHKKQGKKVGLCVGGFDLVHPGHIKHFEAAKKLCDTLIVATTCDDFISIRKGSGRPVYHEGIRAYALASLEYIDYVVVARFRTGLDVVENVAPNVYFKGPDFKDKFTPELWAEKAAIEKMGGELILTTEPNLSTTKIIEYIKYKLDIKQVLVVKNCADSQIVTDFIKYLSSKCKATVAGPEEVADKLSEKSFDKIIILSDEKDVLNGYEGLKTQVVHILNKEYNELVLEIDGI